MKTKYAKGQLVKLLTPQKVYPHGGVFEISDMWGEVVLTAVNGIYSVRFGLTPNFTITINVPEVDLTAVVSPENPETK